LIPLTQLGATEHGGDTRDGLRKTRRPFSPDSALHLVFKSTRAKGNWSLLHRRNRAQVEKLIYTQASKAHVRVYRLANVGNHIHLLVKAPYRESLAKFLRAVPGLIARHVTQARKGLKLTGRFWERSAYSRLVHWGREFKALTAYLNKNLLKACGFSGARLRFKPSGEAVILIGGDPDFRPDGRPLGVPIEEMCNFWYGLRQTE
jgi:REP element-mobilizing transposase RayT